MAASSKQPALETSFKTAFAEIRKKYGSNTIMLAKDMGKVNRIPVGIPSLDLQLGGGLPMSRIIHVYGAEHAAKTFLCMQIAAALQKNKGDKMVFWLDLERSFEPIRAKQVGIDLDRLIVCRPASAEPGFDELIEMIPYISGGVVDSVAAISSVTEIEGTMGDKQVGMVAALMAKFFHKWISDTSPEKLGDGEPPMLLLTNQLRDDIGAYVKKTKTTGGRSMRHYPSVFIELARGPLVKLKALDAEGEEVVIGHDVKFKIPKNNTFQPDKTGSFMLSTKPHNLGGYTLLANQVDWPKDLLKYAVHYEVIKKSGSWHEFTGKHSFKAQGKLEAQAHLYNDGALAAEIYDLTLQVIRQQHGLEEQKNVSAKVSNTPKVEKPGKKGCKKFGRQDKGGEREQVV